jgi:hypothetical protein
MTAIIRRSLPEAIATVSVVMVENLPAPMKSVGKYCAMETENPVANAYRMGRSKMGNLICQ